MKVGPYSIERELGRGGMGAVYLARDAALDRYVAIKFLSESYAGDAQVRERFLFEARSMAKVSDAHVAQVLSVGEVDQRPYFAMEFLEGGSLSDLLRQQGRLSEQVAAYFIGQAAQGLHAAHEAGLVHRDIKPANLLLSARGLLKVADFGIALAPSAQRTRLTTTGGVIGTPGYLSPEVCLGERVTPAADQFALGIVFFELLTGQVPFQDVSPMRSMFAVVERPTPSLGEHSVQLSPALDAILQRMLAKAPIDRFPSCAHLADAIALAGIDLRARAHSPVPIEINEVWETTTTTKQQPQLRLTTLADGPLATATGEDQTQPQPVQGTKSPAARVRVWAATSVIVISFFVAFWLLKATQEKPTIATPPGKSTPELSLPANSIPPQRQNSPQVTQTPTPAPAAPPEAKKAGQAPESRLGVIANSDASRQGVPTESEESKPRTTSSREIVKIPLTKAPVAVPQGVTPALETQTRSAPAIEMQAVPAIDSSRLPIMVLAEGKHPALETVRARVEAKLRAGGANFLAPKLMQQMRAMALAGDASAAMIAARGKAIAMLEITQDDDDPTQLRVRVYEVTSRVSRGSWRLPLNSNGDDVKPIDAFTFAEIAAQVKGYGG
jgi:serine/threonine protein kinase